VLRRYIIGKLKRGGNKNSPLTAGRHRMSPRFCTPPPIAAALAVPVALAQQQQPQTQRVSGTIERVDGNTIYGKGPDGTAITLKLTDNVAVTAVLKATFADIKPGDYVGTGGGGEGRGRQEAGGVVRFPPAPAHRG